MAKLSISISPFTYKTILDVQFIVSALDSAAIIYGDDLGGGLPVSVVLLVSQHMSFH